jgi:ubiquitin fusion degradation protein 1
MFLNAAADKLKREQDKRKADLQRKQAAERRAAAAADARRKARDDADRLERAEARQREAEARARAEHILANNEGIAWDARLLGVRSDAAAAKGIRARADDKIVLPPSAWRSLQSAGAASTSGGHLFFEISVGAGADARRTHAGVLGFDGQEGNVGLPAPILRQLGVHPARRVGVDEREDEDEDERLESARTRPGPGADPDPDPDPDPGAASSSFGALDALVSYRRLPKGTYAKLQPRFQDFQGELAAEADVDLRALLESAMTRRCTLTVGDDVLVSRGVGEKTYALRVVEVHPDDAGGAVSLMETDVEVDIAPSHEYEEAMARLAAAESARVAAAAAAAMDADDARREREEKERIVAAREAEEAAAREAAAERAARYRAAMAAALPPEPAGDGDDEGDDAGADFAAMALRFALPDGSTRTRRFAPSDPIRAAFDFVRAVGGAGEGETFRLVTRWPRTTLEEEAADARTVRSAVADPTAALFVEKIARDEEPRQTA